MIGPGSDKSTQIANKINFDRAIIKGTSSLLLTALRMFICCAIGSPDSSPAFLLLAGHSTCVLRWVGRGTRRSDRLPSPVLASLLPRTPHRSLSCSYSFAPNVSFFFWSVNNLRCWMASSQPTSCQAPSPKLLSLPDETLDFLNTTDARHLIVLFWCIVII